MKIPNLEPLCFSHALLVCAALASGHGCSQNDPAGRTPPSAPPGTSTSASLQPGAAPGRAGLDLHPLEVVSGATPVKAQGRGPGRLTLLVDGKPLATHEGSHHKFTWDTSATADGLATVSLQGGPAGKEELLGSVTVVVLNNGSEVFFESGSAGKVIVPPTGYQVQHLRYPWKMDGGVKRLLAVLSWDQPGFDLELAVGTGTCPRHGKSMGSKRGATSPVSVLVEAPGGGSLDEGRWFAHVALQNADAVLGRETAFEIKAFLLK